MPWYVTAVLAAFNLASGGGFGFIRAVRLIRVFRVFKLGRYSTGITIFAGAMTSSMASLSILGFCMMIAMILFGSMIYYAEYDLDNDMGAEGFETIPDSFWWCIVTMTTVGY